MVVHLAAQVDVTTAESLPAVDADINVVGTITVAEATARVGARLVFASSCAVYGEPRRLPVGEGDPIAPSTPYGLSKAAAMEYVEWFARRYGLAATSLILGNVYGQHNTRGVLATFLADAPAGRPSILHANGLPTRDFVHVDDVTRAVVTACSTPAAGRVNIGTGTETSVRELHSLVGAATGRVIEPDLTADADGGCDRMRLRIDRAEQLLGWTPRVRLDAGVRTVAQEYAGEEPIRRSFADHSAFAAVDLDRIRR